MRLKGLEYPIRRFKVPSRSNPLNWHIVELWSDGKLYCDCIAGSYNRPCKHKELIEKHLEKEKNG